MLAIDGKYRYISLELKGKLEEYMDMDSNTSVREMVRSLKIGNSTALKFRRWRKI